MTIRDLYFTPKQAECFKTLDDNSDLVERVKAKARENDDLSTCEAVLSLAKYRKEKTQSQYRLIDDDGWQAKILNNAVYAVGRLPADLVALDAMVTGLLSLADNMFYTIGQTNTIHTAIRCAF